MRTLIGYSTMDGMPRQYFLTENGELYLADEGEFLEMVRYETVDIVILGEPHTTVKAKTIARMLSTLTSHTVDSHVEAMQAAVRRIKKYLVVDTSLALNIMVDAGITNPDMLVIESLDDGYALVREDRFDDPDSARQWGKRFIEALEDLGIKVNVKWISRKL